MKPAYLIYLATIRRELARKNAEANYSIKRDLSSASPSKAPIIV